MNADQFDNWLQDYQLSTPNNFKKPLIMGIVNVTQDSFYDGTNYLNLDKATAHALKLIKEGADIIDIGGESSRPGAAEVSSNVELERVIPLIKQIRASSDCCISIDTYKPEVMQAAVEAGGNLINDIYALRQEGSVAMVAQLGVPVCLMHMKGQPKSMQNNPHYANGVVSEVVDFFVERIHHCQEQGIAKNRLIIDPGFGFGKQVDHNLILLKQLAELTQFNLPVLLGVSRKSTIGAVLNKEVNERLIGSIALAVYATLQGVSILRVHDVDETRQAVQMINAIYQTI
ncbi:dihydropteroate synthase [Legionella sp. km772]|uniref:dihydropteroate synthase n=1 Tax=Legionella sp. km772 TaxID=2498111 RepID=UPI000F8C90F3|nr:dihydropteroate synthase [Legionella sp. km772]RUR13971.1 dihydropteroate synthase [Legionella sp. km772]